MSTADHDYHLYGRLVDHRRRLGPTRAVGRARVVTPPAEQAAAEAAPAGPTRRHGPGRHRRNATPRTTGDAR